MEHAVTTTGPEVYALNRRWLCAGLILMMLCALLTACGAKRGGDVQVLMDGAEWDGRPLPLEGDDLRVVVTLDGETLIELPFSQPRVLTIRQPGVGENTVSISGEAVVMTDADCENHDCVEMGAVTRDNLELRVMGGFIVCLPHKLSVEVREN